MDVSDAVECLAAAAEVEPVRSLAVVFRQSAALVHDTGDLQGTLLESVLAVALERHPQVRP